jgi:hypothetical protein
MEEFGDTKEVIINRKSEDRQHSGQKDKERFLELDLNLFHIENKLQEQPKY